MVNLFGKKIFACGALGHLSGGRGGGRGAGGAGLESQSNFTLKIEVLNPTLCCHSQAEST
jgi:hypothetical protein